MHFSQKISALYSVFGKTQTPQGAIIYFCDRQTSHNIYYNIREIGSFSTGYSQGDEGYYVGYRMHTVDRESSLFICTHVIPDPKGLHERVKQTRKGLEALEDMLGQAAEMVTKPNITFDQCPPAVQAAIKELEASFPEFLQELYAV